MVVVVVVVVVVRGGGGHMSGRHGVMLLMLGWLVLGMLLVMLVVTWKEGRRHCCDREEEIKESVCVYIFCVVRMFVVCEKSKKSKIDRDKRKWAVCGSVGERGLER